MTIMIDYFLIASWENGKQVENTTLIEKVPTQ